MAVEPGAAVSVVPSIVTASAGLLGVIVGGAIAWAREMQKEWSSARKERVLLAILVSAHLDRLVDECVAVSFDDGTYQGQPSGSDGQTYEAVVDLPNFDPLSLDVQWRVLPPTLMQEILVLPHRIEKLRRKLRDIAEIDFPPDYEMFFSARQYDFTILGLDVVEVIGKLRAEVRLKEELRSTDGWDRQTGLQEQKEKFEVRRAARDLAHARMMRELNSSDSTCTG